MSQSGKSEQTRKLEKIQGISDKIYNKTKKEIRIRRTVVRPLDGVEAKAPPPLPIGVKDG